MTTIFRAIGWQAGQLDGGYKAWRSHVMAELARLPQQFTFEVVCGPTGSGKTRILQAIADLGEQVLDLETLACHKGSVLGVLPDQPQPAQKRFETRLLQEISSFDPVRPVYVEAESRKIGRLHVPDALLERIRLGRCLSIDATTDARVAFLQQDYDYFLKTPDFLIQRLEPLKNQQSREIINRWLDLVQDRSWPELVRELLDLHYDPHYRRSQDKNYLGLQAPVTFATDDLSAVGIRNLAHAIVHERRAHTA